MVYRFDRMPESVIEWTVEVAPFMVSITKGRKRGAQRFYSYYCSQTRVQFDYYVTETGESGVSRLAWGRASVETHYHVRNMLPSGAAFWRSKKPKRKVQLEPDDDGNQQKKLI